MSKRKRVYEIVPIGRLAERRLAERAAAKAAAALEAAAAAEARRLRGGRVGRPSVKGGVAHTAGWGERERRKRREAREALAAAFAGGTAMGLRLAQRERERAAEVVGSPSPDVVVLPEQGIKPAAVAVAGPAVGSDGEVPAGWFRLGSELIRIGRDDLADLGRRRVVGSPFGRGRS
jgi:hypothetical protein